MALCADRRVRSGKSYWHLLASYRAAFDAHEAAFGALAAAEIVGYMTIILTMVIANEPSDQSFGIQGQVSYSDG